MLPKMVVPPERNWLISPPEEVGDGLGHDPQGQWVARVRLHQAGALVGGAHDLVLREQVLAGGGLQPSQAQGAHRRAAALQGAQLGRFLPAGQQQATLVRRLGHLPQRAAVRFKARTQVPSDLAFREQALQVVEHQQHPRGVQLLQQEAQASLQTLGCLGQRLGCKHLQTALQQGVARRGIAQRAKDHDLEVVGQLVHGAGHQRRFANAAQA